MAYIPKERRAEHVVTDDDKAGAVKIVEYVDGAIMFKQDNEMVYMSAAQVAAFMAIMQKSTS